MRLLDRLKALWIAWKCVYRGGHYWQNSGLWVKGFPLFICSKCGRRA